jgi:hypothetical protein
MVGARRGRGQRGLRGHRLDGQRLSASSATGSHSRS